MMKMETDKIIDEQVNTNTQVSLNFINISEAENMIRVNKKKKLWIKHHVFLEYPFAHSKHR